LKTLFQLLLLTDLVGFSGVPLQVFHHMQVLYISWADMQPGERVGRGEELGVA